MLAQCKNLSILERRKWFARTVGFTGRIELDQSKPDGTPRKLTDITLLRSTGWMPRVSLEDGLQKHTQLFLAETQSQTRREL